MSVIRQQRLKGFLGRKEKQIVGGIAFFKIHLGYVSFLRLTGKFAYLQNWSRNNQFLNFFLLFKTYFVIFSLGAQRATTPSISTLLGLDGKGAKE